MKAHPLIFGLIMVLLTAVTVDADAQKLYKWVDKDGNIHYSDHVPRDDLDQAREEMNQQGVVVGRVDRAKTDEELAVEQEAQRAADAAADAAERQAMADRKVLSAYASEQGIIRIRDQRLDTLDRQIQSSQAFIGGQTQSLARLMGRAAELESQGLDVSAALHDSIEVIRQQIRDQDKNIDAKENEKAALAAEYEGELKRYREVANRRLSSSEG